VEKVAFLDYFRRVKSSKNKIVPIGNLDTLPTFSDMELGLCWNRISSDNVAEYEEYFDEMLEWSKDDGVKRFIASQMPINKLFRYCVSENSPSNRAKCNLYFCFNENNDFVGLSYISAPLGTKKYSVIEYLIVNPEFQRQGISTKMIDSMSKHIKYFSNGYDSEGIMSSVERENIASSRAFERNGYSVIDTNISDTGRNYLVYYLNVKENTCDKGGMAG
jgi:RimJ/RimL family protein N-acetyltransferase